MKNYLNLFYLFFFFKKEYLDIHLLLHFFFDVWLQLGVLMITKDGIDVHLNAVFVLSLISLLFNANTNICFIQCLSFMCLLN